MASRSNWTSRLYATNESWSLQLENAWKKARQRASRKPIHELRISIRRMSALLEILNALTKHPRIRKLTRKLKKTQRNLGRLRDLDVQVQLAKTDMSLPERDILLVHLKQERQGEQKHVLKHLSGSRRKELRREVMQLFRKTASILDNMTAADARRAVRGAITRRNGYQEPRESLETIDPERLHELRISARKLRFALETAAAIFPETSTGRLDELRDAQRRMGEIRDRQLLQNSYSVLIAKR